MTGSIDHQYRRWPAPCLGARRLLAITVVASVLVVLGVAAGLALRLPWRPETAGAWIRAFSLSAPALWVAGSPMRHPETIHPGVDLRYTIGTEIVP